MPDKKTAEQQVNELGCALQLVMALLVLTGGFGARYLYDRIEALEDRVEQLEQP